MSTDIAICSYDILFKLTSFPCCLLRGACACSTFSSTHQRPFKHSEYVQYVIHLCAFSSFTSNWYLLQVVLQYFLLLFILQLVTHTHKRPVDFSIFFSIKSCLLQCPSILIAHAAWGTRFSCEHNCVAWIARESAFTCTLAHAGTGISGSDII